MVNALIKVSPHNSDTCIKLARQHQHLRPQLRAEIILKLAIILSASLCSLVCRHMQKRHED
jgi:hypothetical protein